MLYVGGGCNSAGWVLCGGRGDAGLISSEIRFSVTLQGEAGKGAGAEKGRRRHAIISLLRKRSRSSGVEEIFLNGV